MSTINSRSDKTSSKQSPSHPSHQFAPKASWWLDFYTMAGRKSENQDSLLMTTCLTGYFTSQTQGNQPTIAPHHLPVLAVLADGVSACQFPKQASRLAVEILTQAVIKGLEALYEQTDVIAGQLDWQTYKDIFDDDSVAGVIKRAATKANDAMFFSQAYQRVPPLLSTLSGVLCIGDRVYMFHTGDSRIYRVGADSLTVLSEDHRIHHGQDKGALSAALGADTRIDLQQSVLTLHQNEYLALMTDGVYEFIDPVEMQFECSAAVAHLEDTPDWSQLTQWDLSRQLCHLAHSEGSNDNLSMIMLGMGASLGPEKQGSKSAASSLPLTSLSLTDGDSVKTAGRTHLTSSIVIPFLRVNLSRQTSESTTHCRLSEFNKDRLFFRIGMINAEGIPDHNADRLNDATNTKTAPNTKIAPLNRLAERTVTEPTPETAMPPVQYRLPTGLEIGDAIDGFVVDKIIARTARSEVYLVHDSASHPYVLKSPSMMTVDDGHYLRDFLKERKIGLSLSKHRRAGESAYNQTNPNQGSDIQNGRLNQSKTGDTSHAAPEGSGLSETGLLRYYPVPASSTYLYHLTEYIDGESLRMFMERNGACDVWQTHDLLTKIGMAVRVMHRNYLLHQDIKPENVLLTKSGAVKLIDFGSTGSSILKDNTRPPVGDLHYAAPEYYTDAPKGVYSDLFSIAVIGYELLTGELPFTSQMLMSGHDALVVPTNLLHQKQVPATSQQALLRALHRNINARHQAIGEFLQDFNPDNMASLADPEPLIRRNPLLVWHGICLIQFIIIVCLLVKFLPTL